MRNCSLWHSVLFLSLFFAAGFSWSAVYRSAELKQVFVPRVEHIIQRGIGHSEDAGGLSYPAFSLLQSEFD
jgi:hypothetical protein